MDYSLHMYNKNLLPLKGVYLSKALTCMNFSFINRNDFYQEDGYLSPHCCMNNLYISHSSLYVPTYSFWEIRSMRISLFRVISWFDTVCNIVTRWVNFRKKNSCININYNYPTTIFRSIIALMYKCLVEKYNIFTIGTQDWCLCAPLNHAVTSDKLILFFFL